MHDRAAQYILAHNLAVAGVAIVMARPRVSATVHTSCIFEQAEIIITRNIMPDSAPHPHRQQLELAFSRINIKGQYIIIEIGVVYCDIDS